jgi:hypothetical protein
LDRNRAKAAAAIEGPNVELVEGDLSKPQSGRPLELKMVGKMGGRPEPAPE